MSTIVTFDGTAGNGKSTIGRAVADALSFEYVNIGSIYRDIARRLVVEANSRDSPLHSLANMPSRRLLGLEFNAYDREDMGLLANIIAQDSVMRTSVIERVRLFARGRSLIVDGRNTGTTIFPEACIRFYFDAPANRRAQQILGPTASAARVYNFANRLSQRDHHDQSRPIDPLELDPGATKIDTTRDTIGLVITEIRERIRYDLSP